MKNHLHKNIYEFFTAHIGSIQLILETKISFLEIKRYFGFIDSKYGKNS